MSGTGTHGNREARSRVTRAARGPTSSSKPALSREENQERSTTLANPHVSEDMDAKRAALLAEKQRQLEKVNHQHDNLVRELFQMDHFTMMISYDPAEAKTDNTNVFREYKSKFDLIDNTIPVAGPSRQTRGRLNERRQFLSTTSISAPLLPTTTPTKRKTKPKIAPTPEIVPVSTPVQHPRGWKGKGKAKEFMLDSEVGASVAENVVSEPMESVSAPVIDEWPATVVVHRQPPRRKRPALSPPPIPPVPAAVEAPRDEPFPPCRTDIPMQLEPLPGDNPVLEEVESVPMDVDVLEQTKKPISAAILMNGRTNRPPCPSIPPNDSVSVGFTRRSGRLREPSLPNSPSKIKIRVPFEDKILSAPQVPPPLPHVLPPDTAPPPPTKPTVKRIRLIVRRPPPSLTNPRQMAPPPKFGLSLNKFLHSYTRIDEGHDTNSATLERESQAEAEIREEVVRFRNEGRFIPGTEALFGTTVYEVPYTSPSRTTMDIWDAVVDTVVVRARSMPKKSVGRQIAAQIASKVQAYFDGLEVKKLKAKEAEERRLRNLAKSTVKLVLSEWKKAVYHIREKQRQEQEAEERRLGRAHLDAILDQSGQLLETQQGELLRRSRSESIGGLEEEEDEADDEVDGEEGEDEGDGGEDQEFDVPRSAHSIQEEGESSSMLLVDAPTRPQTPLSTRPASPSSDGDEEEADDAEVATAQLLNGSGPQRDVEMHSDTSSEADLQGLAVPDPVTSPLKLATVSPFELTTDVQGEFGECPSPVLDVPLECILDKSVEIQVDSRSTPNGHSPIFDSASESRPITSSVHDSPELGETPVNAFEDDLQMESTEDPPEAVVRDLEDMNENQQEVEDEDEDEDEEDQAHESSVEKKDVKIPEYLKPYAVAPVEWDLESKVTPPLLLRGVLRPYQQSGLEWLASLHVNRLNGILADEMGLGKTIQTIALLAHLACDRGIWGPHLIVVPTSVLLNWEMEFKKFLPGFRILSYHGSMKRRKELRQGWNDKFNFNVCITSYTLASKDAHIFKRKAWYYMILDEAHMIKNFKSQRWNILLMFRSYRRLLLTGTPLQNNLTELWALLQFLMSGANFANLKEFGEWFSNPLERAIEMGNAHDDETIQRVSKLHTVLRPYLLRRLKRDVEKELPSKFEHLTLCPLSKRQRFLYDEFMSRAQTRDALGSGVYQKIANILMQLRKVCNHPDLFEVRPIVTSFAMARSAIADFEIKELLVRRRLLADEDDHVNLDVIGLRFVNHQNVSLLAAAETRRLDATKSLSYFSAILGQPPPKDLRTIAGYRKYSAYLERAKEIARWSHTGYLNKLRCSRIPLYSYETLTVVRQMTSTIIPLTNLDPRTEYMENVYHVNSAVKSYDDRGKEMSAFVDRFAFITQPVVALDLPRIALTGSQHTIQQQPSDFDAVLHSASVRLQIAFPDPSLLQYDCGKLQKLADLLREKKAGGHRILIFTQMTRILDILEIFLNFHGYLYLRLDGATKIEDRQYITERFNADPRIFCFIASSRSGGVGINLTGADTVVFYDSDFNPQMDRQCEDRAHRIGQIRDVHIYRFVSQYTVEEAMLRKANQKRSLDDLVIQKGEFDWRSLFNEENTQTLTRALGDFEDAEDSYAAAVAAREEFSLVGADEADFGDAEGGASGGVGAGAGSSTPAVLDDLDDVNMTGGGGEAGMDEEEQDEQGGSVVDYMLAFIEADYDYFREWRL